MITNFKNTDNIDNFLEKELNMFNNIGNKLLKDNKIGVIILAGGQGTRLGLEKPKGTLLLNNKSLFQIHIEKLQNMNTHIPLYIMTSVNTHDDTINFFEENNYFNYKKNNIIFFQQGNNHCLDKIGGNKIIKEIKNNQPIYATCPNGNGGIYEAIHSNCPNINNSIYDDFVKRGLEYIFIQNVDNPIVKLCDPIFLGYHNYYNLEISCKVCPKQDPDEKVGIFCYKDDKPNIVEYYELQDDMRYLKDKNNNLIYNQANISIHILSVNFIDKIKDIKLEYHYAKKKIEYWDDKLKRTIKPETENGYKPEYFIFDMFKYCPKDKMRLLTINRDSEFCPIKNKDDIILTEKIINSSGII